MGLKYTIPEILALDILRFGTSVDDIRSPVLDVSTDANQHLIHMSQQEDCPLFHQAMKAKTKGKHIAPAYLDSSLPLCRELENIFLYVDFSGIFDRHPSDKTKVLHQKAKALFSPDGFLLKREYRYHKYVAFERSASMSRQSRLCFVEESYFLPLTERITLGMKIEQCQLSKLYAYNGLMFTGGTRIATTHRLRASHILLIDNPKTIIPNVPAITVEDDGTNVPIRKYHRVEKVLDIPVTEFDGEGLVSLDWARDFNAALYAFNHPQRGGHSSFQIRMPYIKGVVHTVDFVSLFRELGVSKVKDRFGVFHSVEEIGLILTTSMFKGLGWMEENGLSWEEYLKRCRSYDHALYVSGTDNNKANGLTELNYQFLNTAAITAEEFRPLALPLGWNTSPELRSEAWLTKATEAAWYHFARDKKAQLSYFQQDVLHGEYHRYSARNHRANLLEKNPAYLCEKIFQKELTDKAEQIRTQYSLGKLQVAGDNRYLSDDLLRLLAHIIQPTAADAYRQLEKEFLKENTIYAPQPTYTVCNHYTLLRNPHIARNEEVAVTPLSVVGRYRERYLSHLSYVVMVDSRSLIPERLGGADFDGDMVKTIAEPLLNQCICRNDASGKGLPLLKIPAAEPLIQNAQDWQARYDVIRSTFSSRVGQISNAALRRSIMAYDENTDTANQQSLKEDVETLAILTGLEIDSAKSGIRPDLSAYLGQLRMGSSFLKYKNILVQSSNPKWFEESTNQQLKKYFSSIDWNSVTANLEKLPYYAWYLSKESPMQKPVPAKDEELFLFAASPDWKKRLNPAAMAYTQNLIADYREALRRTRYMQLTKETMVRKSDIQRILFARNQEDMYTTEELYDAFQQATPMEIRKMRHILSSENWILSPPEKREDILQQMQLPAAAMAYQELFTDFRCAGYQILGDIICDYDDLYSEQGYRRHIHNQKGDSEELRSMMSGIQIHPNTRQVVADRCHAVANSFSRDEIIPCAAALGERQFLLEVFPGELLAFTVDANAKAEQPFSEQSAPSKTSVANHSPTVTERIQKSLRRFFP